MRLERKAFQTAYGVQMFINDNKIKQSDIQSIILDNMNNSYPYTLFYWEHPKVEPKNEVVPQCIMCDNWYAKDLMLNVGRCDEWSDCEHGKLVSSCDDCPFNGSNLDD